MNVELKASWRSLARSTADLLRDMSLCNEERGCGRIVFLLPSGLPHPVASSLGEQLHAAGGWRAMSRAAKILGQSLPRWMSTDMRELEMCWGGIGQWQC
jgi:hypothetical protein